MQEGDRITIDGSSKTSTLYQSSGRVNERQEPYNRKGSMKEAGGSTSDIAK